MGHYSSLTSFINLEAAVGFRDTASVVVTLIATMCFGVGVTFALRIGIAAHRVEGQWSDGIRRGRVYVHVLSKTVAIQEEGSRPGSWQATARGRRLSGRRLSRPSKSACACTCHYSLPRTGRQDTVQPSRICSAKYRSRLDRVMYRNFSTHM